MERSEWRPQPYFEWRRIYTVEFYLVRTNINSMHAPGSSHESQWLNYVNELDIKMRWKEFRRALKSRNIVSIQSPPMLDR